MMHYQEDFVLRKVLFRNSLCFVEFSLILISCIGSDWNLWIFVGKYFLLDSGYALRKGFLPPYKKVRYHLKEFDESSPPMNVKELFNLRHSSLRISVERAFGVLKKRFRVLDAEPFWEFDMQVKVVLVCCVCYTTFFEALIQMTKSWERWIGSSHVIFEDRNYHEENSEKKI